MKIRAIPEKIYEWHLKKSIRHVPGHIAIIMDGNRRYASILGKNTAFGHSMGAETTERVLEWARDIGVRSITLYTFSTENFSRSEEELSELFSLFTRKFGSVRSDERFHANGICLRVVGDRSRIPAPLLATIEDAEAATRDYDRFFLNIALAYGGRNEIIRSAQGILEDEREGRIRPDEITAAMVEEKICADTHLAPVDLIIRTGNEQRTSNFLPWLANGYESAVYFCAPYWPLFRKIDLLRGIRVYNDRVRNHHLPNRRVRI
ncbi:UDP pyrophosphate synthase [Methanomicrobiaceae archaeon CYW5]|uniref:polyprenyl diphosphate synthase n=1 Tax=Methanovulcanius yangii TaxID=1789227 RepID=UPI0029CA1796|nr:polyprenyl diphosphate synthase [Methanovulcanius yangii]MBT8507497.1 UDP pyrophosphate synthase [Methanovulcanius yangii]